MSRQEINRGFLTAYVILLCHIYPVVYPDIAQPIFLPRRNTSDEEIISQMEKRHRKRQSAIESQKRKQEIAGVD